MGGEVGKDGAGYTTRVFHAVGEEGAVGFEGWRIRASRCGAENVILAKAVDLAAVWLAILNLGVARRLVAV